MHLFFAPDRIFSRSWPVVLMVAAWLSVISTMGYACGITVTKDTTLFTDLIGCEGDGIIIAAEGVTLNLNGHSIIGQRKERTAGIRVQGVNNVTIKNGTVSSFERGIYVYDVDKISIHQLEISSSRYEGLMAYQSSAMRVEDNLFTQNTRAAIWIYDSNAELVGNLGIDNPNRTFYLSGGRIGMSGNVARGGAYYSAFSFANGYTESDYLLQDNLAEDIIGVGYLFSWGFAGDVTDGLGNSAVNIGGDECWTQEGVACPLDLDSVSSSSLCGNDRCEAEESVCTCSSDCGLPPSESCDDGIDNDCDGDVDCDDAHCALEEICYTPPVSVTVECELPGTACSHDSDCCTGDCRINARSRMGGTCR